MTERKFTDEEVIKALECCGSKHTGNEGEYSCLRCPLNELNDCNCLDNILHDLSFDLINRKNAEIESLKKILHELKMEAEMVYKQRDMLKNQVNLLKRYDEERDIRLHARLTENARAEAIKEFAERLKKAKQYSLERRENIVPVAVIDWIVKEMTEEKE